MIPREGSALSKCKIFNVTLNEAILARELNQSINEDRVVSCEKWDYDRNEVPYESIASEVSIKTYYYYKY